MTTQDTLYDLLNIAQKNGYTQGTTGLRSISIKEVATPEGVTLATPITSAHLYSHLQLLPPQGDVTAWVNGASDQEEQILGYFRMATSQLENVLAMPIIPKVYDIVCSLTSSGSQTIILPTPFITSVVSILSQGVDLLSLATTAATDEATAIALPSAAGRQIVIRVVAGLGTASVFPEDLRATLLKLTAHLFTYRGDVLSEGLELGLRQVYNRYYRYPEMESTTSLVTQTTMMLPAYAVY